MLRNEVSHTIVFLARVVIEIIRPKDNFIQLDLAEKKSLAILDDQVRFLIFHLPVWTHV